MKNSLATLQVSSNSKMVTVTRWRKLAESSQDKIGKKQSPHNIWEKQAVSVIYFLDSFFINTVIKQTTNRSNVLVVTKLWDFWVLHELSTLTFWEKLQPYYDCSSSQNF